MACNVGWRCAAAILFAALACATASATTDDCVGAPVVLQAQVGEGTQQVFSAMPSQIGGPLPQAPNATLRLKVADPLDGCTAASQPHSKGTAVLASRGNCSFVEKAEVAEAAGAAMLIVFDTEPGCIAMAGGNTTQARLKLQAISVAAATGAALLKTASRKGTVDAFWPAISPLDWSQVLLFVLAVGTVAVGSCWVAADDKAASGRQYKQYKQLPADEAPPADSASDGSDEGPLPTSARRQDNISPRLRRSASAEPAGAVQDSAVPGPLVKSPSFAQGPPDVMVVTPRMAVAYLFIASFVLVGLYWAIDYINTVIVVLFCAGAQSAIIAVIREAVVRAWPRSAQHTVRIPCTHASAETLPLAIMPFTVGAAVVWAFSRASAWGWIFQDIMGVCLVLSCLRAVRVQSLRVATLLLGLMLCYDAFFVFIQARLTHSPSVMVEVATGGASHEPLPIVLLVPALTHFRAKGFAMLGLGDMALPGTLAALCRCRDAEAAAAGRRSSCWRAHFLPAMVAYTAGLLLTYAALFFSWFGDSGQPALIYIVPCMLLAVAASAAARGELKAMWVGEQPLAGDEEERHMLQQADASAGV